MAAISTFTSKEKPEKGSDDFPSGCGIPSKHGCPGLWIENPTYGKGCEKRPRGIEFGIAYATVVTQPILNDDLIFEFEDNTGTWQVTVTGERKELSKLGRVITHTKLESLHVGGGVTGITVSKAC